jgi:hypothetical protein
MIDLKRYLSLLVISRNYVSDASMKLCCVEVMQSSGSSSLLELNASVSTVLVKYMKVFMINCAQYFYETFC